MTNTAVINDLRIEIIDWLVAHSMRGQEKVYDLSSVEDRTIKKYDEINEKLKTMKWEFAEKKWANMKSESFKLPSIDQPKS